MSWIETQELKWFIKTIQSWTCWHNRGSRIKQRIVSFIHRKMPISKIQLSEEL
ncbi:hypothetical protein Glove_159g9 [Diversispora epigaea]|uniref:Uncharacterized protein n=1 Tax=Diversispora epigaea TaxID=1348612 RepID=A0A397J004_9GLOM|nr:hypothetical protein Glove_159g9 [Diversispora epigaea]